MARALSEPAAKDLSTPRRHGAGEAPSTSRRKSQTEALRAVGIGFLKFCLRRIIFSPVFGAAGG